MPKKNDATHGGARPGGGRPSLNGGGPSRVIRLRVPDELAEKFDRCGGSAWVRDLMERATDEPAGGAGKAG